MSVVFNKPVRFCKRFPPAVIRNKLFAMGYHNAAKERGISIDRLLGTLPRPVLNDLACLLNDDKDQANWTRTYSNFWGG